LQFPEGLKRRGPAVADDLRALADDEVTFMLGTAPATAPAISIRI